MTEPMVVWLECPCERKSAAFVFRHPDALPHNGMPILAEQFIGLDGEPVGATPACATCGRRISTHNHDVFTERAMRRGDRLPDAVWERHAPARVTEDVAVDPATGRVTFAKGGE